jgi:D-alanine-D-alanine ligase
VAAAAEADRLGAMDMVFLALHGGIGEDGTLQGFLDTCGIPYVGSGVAASALAMDKGLSRRIATSLGLRVAPAVEGFVGRADARAGLLNAAARLALPLFVKPNGSGSSVGVSRVAKAAELGEAVARAAAECAQVLIESAVAGREVSCPVLGDAHRDARALPVVEVVPKRQAFFDYRAKYTEGETEEICPARLEAAATKWLQAAAVRLHDALGCRSLSRSDFIVPADGGEPVFLEINTLPGMTPLSLLPLAARTEGMSYERLCAHLVEHALARQRRIS